MRKTGGWRSTKLIFGNVIEFKWQKEKVFGLIVLVFAKKKFLKIVHFVHSALNPIIYGFMCRSFRENFLKSVCACVRSNSGSAAAREARMKQLASCNNTQAGNGNAGNGGLRINRSRGMGGAGYINYKGAGNANIV